jgi:hypothetical protein
MKKILLIAVCLISGCVQLQTGWTRSELYFGLSKADGQTVSQQQWEEFVTTTVTPRFPEGLTVTDAAGQYRSQSGELVKESSKVMVIYRKVDETGDQKLEEIRKVYKERFGQESVLRAESPATVDF